MSFLKTISRRVLLFTSGFGAGTFAYFIDSIHTPLVQQLNSNQQDLNSLLQTLQSNSRVTPN